MAEFFFRGFFVCMFSFGATGLFAFTWTCWKDRDYLFAGLCFMMGLGIASLIGVAVTIHA